MGSPHLMGHPQDPSTVIIMTTGLNQSPSGVRGSLGARLRTSDGNIFRFFLSFLFFFIFLLLLVSSFSSCPNLKTFQPQLSTVSKVSQQVRAVLGNQVVELFLLDALLVNYEI